jgi:hypothetical protein
MPTEPLSARLFRFLAVLAPVSFIVLMLGTGSYVGQSFASSFSFACHGKFPQNRFCTPLHKAAPAAMRLAMICQQCASCFIAEYYRCCPPGHDEDGIDLCNNLMAGACDAQASYACQDVCGEFVSFDDMNPGNIYNGACPNAR